MQYSIGKKALLHAQAAVAPLKRRLDLKERLRPYEAHRYPAEATAVPTLHLDDLSGIPFLDRVVGVEKYQLRARVRAATGHLYAAISPPEASYEVYCRGRLGLGMPEFVPAEAIDGPMAVARACAESPAFGVLARRAAEAGGLTIHPYMSIEDVWGLAGRLATESGVSIRVMGPPPPITWIANDKALTTEVVRRVAGEEYIVETTLRSRPEEIARELQSLARRHARVGLKRTRCSSAMGNRVFSAEELRGDQEEVQRVVEEFLRETRWEGDEEVLIVVWEETDLSPSTQLWIPPDGAGPPRLDGIYEQILEGEEKVFVGSRPSRLPERANADLARVSLQVAAAFQSLGYTGRCSFDLLVLGDPHGDFQVRITECNGRWGGTSTPMHLVDRLFPRGRPPYLATDYMHADLVGVPFAEVLRRTGEDLLDPATGRGRFVFYNPGALEKKGKLCVIGIADSPAAAERAVRVDLARILGLR